MSTVKKGILAPSPQWWRHLRPYFRRKFWKSQRRAEHRDLVRQLYDSHNGKRGWGDA